MLNKLEIKKKQELLNKADISVAGVFKVLGDVNRYRIFQILTRHTMLTVSDIAQVLNISLPLASQHIKILSLTNLVQKEKVGKVTFIKIEHENPFVSAILKTVQHVVHFKNNN